MKYSYVYDENGFILGIREEKELIIMPCDKKKKKGKKGKK